jgi:hypothetical protein
MITWYYIKNWFKKSKKPQDIVKPSIATRKERNNALLTDEEVYVIRKECSIKTYAEFTKVCNDELEISKSRSVYHRIINKEGRYSVKEV